jgi:AraC family transcriptional regulator
VEAPPTISTQLLQKAQFAVTRVTWDKRDYGYNARMAREDAFLVCLQARRSG